VKKSKKNINDACIYILYTQQYKAEFIAGIKIIDESTFLVRLHYVLKYFVWPSHNHTNSCIMMQNLVNQTFHHSTPMVSRSLSLSICIYIYICVMCIDIYIVLNIVSNTLSHDSAIQEADEIRGNLLRWLGNGGGHFGCYANGAMETGILIYPDVPIQSSNCLRMFNV